MAQFSVKTKNARIQANDEEKLARELRQIEQEISVIGNNLGFRIATQQRIRSRLNQAAERVSAHRSGMKRMESALNDILNTYEETEQQILDGGQLKEMTMRNEQGSVAVADGGWESVIGDWIKGLLEDANGKEYKDYLIKRLEEIQGFVADIQTGDMSALFEALLIPPLMLQDIDAFKSFLDNLKDTVQDKIIDVTSFNAEKKVKGSLWSKELSGRYGSCGVSAGAYEAYASAEGGMFTKDDDGNMLFNPNIDAKMGASFCALSVAGNVAVGDTMLGTHAEGEAVVGKVSAEVEAKASWLDENGNVNPNASLHAGAEAIAVEAKAQAGVTVVGTEIDVSGSVYVGMGAHADFDFGDGKIKCDIGAALGVGVSLGFEIDYGGTIDAIKKGTKSVLEKIWPF